MNKTWQINKKAAHWECNPKDEELFHLRYFRSLPMEKKIQAVEEMCALATELGEKNPKAEMPRYRGPQNK